MKIQHLVTPETQEEFDILVKLDVMGIFLSSRYGDSFPRSIGKSYVVDSDELGKIMAAMVVKG